MGRKIKKWAKILLFCLMMILPETGYGRENTMTVTQTDAYLPEFTAYLRMEGTETPDASSVTGKIDGTDTTLSVEKVQKMSECGQGIRYYILLDISTSISDEQFRTMKEAVIGLSENLREQDSMEVITFGQKVKAILQGGESSNVVHEKINGLTQEKKTHLYEGISYLASQAQEDREQEVSENRSAEMRMRRVGIILTDWQEIKDVGGNTSEEESLLALQEEGIPLYGYCPDTVKDTVQDDMGVFLRKSGGEFRILNEKESGQILLPLSEELLDETVVYFQSSSNKMYDESKVLEVTVGEQTVKKENVYLTKAVEDTDSPEILEVEQKGENARTLVIHFSEDVRNADNKGNYSILREGKQVYTVSEAAYTVDNGEYQATLILNDNLVKGEYEISTVNITDNTNEENLLSAVWTGNLEGQGLLMALYGKLGRFWAVILAAVVLMIIGAIYFIIKKHNGIMVMENKMVLGSNLEQKQHVKNDESSTKDVLLLISGIASENRQMQARINGSAIVGRSSICDIYFDDLSMSKQHFALEVEKGNVYVTDLESKNGTFVNGKKISGRTPVQNGCIIEAGSVAMTIRW